MNTIVLIFVRLLEIMFVVGAIGCALTVIPMTAYRLLMVLFEPAGQDEESSASASAD